MTEYCALYQVIISIHALRVEGDTSSELRGCTGLTISIHALRVEGDDIFNPERLVTAEFLSTPSGWRATTRLQTS